MINYNPISIIYQSEHSIVLKVQDKGSKKIFALKLIGPLDSRINEMIFLRETNALKKLNKYDNIVKIYDSTAGLTYQGKSNYGGILLEYVEGTTLNNYDYSSLSDLEKYLLCLKIAKAVQNAHANGVLHRDLKPQNIIINTNTNDVKLIDFGSSKIKSVIDKSTTMPLFSELYSAPEILKGLETTEASDIYSLGIIFYEIFIRESIDTIERINERIKQSRYVLEMKNLLFEMIHVDTHQRISDIQKVIDNLLKLIGVLNIQNNKYLFQIDSTKLEELKRNFIVENNMNFNIFTSVYLKKEFSEAYGMYNDAKNDYYFIGDKLYFESIYDSNTEMFIVTKMYKFPVERKAKFIRKAMALDGEIKFCLSTAVKNYDNVNNERLRILLINYSDEFKSLESKNKLYEELFGKWRESLQESIESTKDKNGKLIYSEYKIENSRLYLTAEEYINGDIDNINSETTYIFEKEVNKRTKTTRIGSLDEIISEDDKIKIVIKLEQKINRKSLESYLKQNEYVIEDYQYKITSFKRQIRSINDLKDNDCISSTFKDVVLDLESPKSISNIKNFIYS